MNFRNILAGAALLAALVTPAFAADYLGGAVKSTDIGGKMPINTDGGCIANGEPIGASGLRQVHEVVTQLRGEAGDRQVEGARTGLIHCVGGFIGADAAASAVHILAAA